MPRTKAEGYSYTSGMRGCAQGLREAMKEWPIDGDVPVAMVMALANTTDVLADQFEAQIESEEWPD